MSNNDELREVQVTATLLVGPTSDAPSAQPTDADVATFVAFALGAHSDTNPIWDVTAVLAETTPDRGLIRDLAQAGSDITEWVVANWTRLSRVRRRNAR